MDVPVGRHLRFVPALKCPWCRRRVNSGLFWGKKTLMMHSVTITLSFLPPIPPGLPRKEFQEKMERMIVDEANWLLTATEAKFRVGPCAFRPRRLASTTCGAHPSGARKARHQMNCAISGASNRRGRPDYEHDTGTSAVTINRGSL